MRPEARRLLQALLKHHHDVTTRNPPGAHVVPATYVIHYSTLCTRAGVPHVLRVVGNFLGEIADWSAEHDYPPLNSLAVNATSGIPGEGYDGAGGFLILNWPAEVAQCIRFTGYPLTVP